MAENADTVVPEVCPDYLTCRESGHYCDPGGPWMHSFPTAPSVKVAVEG